MNSITEKLKRYWYFLTFKAVLQGEGVPYVGKYSDIPKILIETLQRKASICLPKGLYYEIRAKVPTDFGRNKGLAWVYEPGIATDRSYLNGNHFCGYYVLGGFNA